MKTLKILIVIILLLVAVFFIAPFFIADNFVLVEQQEIKAKPETVFRQVNSLKNWAHWSPFEADTTMINKYEGPESGVGAKRMWNGESAGKGAMTIIKSDPYNYIQNKLEFGPDGAGGVGSWNFEKVDDGVNVVWTIHVQDLSYPFEKWISILIKMNMQPLMEKGLQDLKSYAETLPVPPEVKVIDFEGYPFAVIYDSATIDQFSNKFKNNLTELFAYLKKYQVPITGQQFAIYHNWNPEGYTRFSTGIPVAYKRNGNSKIKYTDLPSCKAVFTKHVGGYSSAETHYAIDDYMKDFGLNARDYIWETYAYDPEIDFDSTKWVTFIYYPLK